MDIKKIGNEYFPKEIAEENGGKYVSLEDYQYGDFLIYSDINIKYLYCSYNFVPPQGMIWVDDTANCYVLLYNDKAIKVYEEDSNTLTNSIGLLDDIKHRLPFSIAKDDITLDNNTIEVIYEGYYQGNFGSVSTQNKFVINLEDYTARFYTMQSTVDID